jgi:hypothetical protein
MTLHVAAQGCSLSSMAPDPTKRKRRQKATTEIGRQMMQRERQRLAKEQAALAEKMTKEALANRELRRPIEKAPKAQVGINRSVVRRVAAVLASEGVVVPIKCVAAESYEQMSAWTDFERIAIRFVQYEDVRLLAATLRGLLYHEGGHVRWSVPFRDLAELAGWILPSGVDARTKALHTAWNCLEDQRMETAVVSDSPRKAAYFTPLILTEHASTLDRMAANWPLLVWRRYLPDTVRAQARAMFVTRHNMVGQDGEMLAQELDRIVTTYVMSTDAVEMWQCVMEMLAVLQACQPLASDMEDAGHSQQRTRKLPDDFQGLTIPVDPSMIPKDCAPVDEDIDPSLIEDDDMNMSTDDMDLTEAEMRDLVEILIAAWNHPETLVEVRYTVNTPPQASGEGEGSKDEDEDFKGGAGSLLDENEDQAEAPELPADSTPEDDEAADADADTASDEADQDVPNEAGDDVAPPVEGVTDDDDDADDDEDEGQHEDADESDDDGHGGSEDGTHTDHEAKDAFTQEDLDELLHEAEEERYNQRDLDGDMEAFHDAVDNGATDLDTYSGGVEQNDVLVAQAEGLAQDIEDAFHAHTMDKAPAWVEQQRRGVLNVGRYMTRAPGDTEFFRQWTEDDQPGFDIAVSVLLDYSGSMYAHTTKLAQAGYACKLACQKLDIPCTVVLWDTEALTLWDANESAEMLPTIEANGGTVPDMALADLDNQRCERSKHLVLIMTDGQWQGRWSSGGGTLAWYKDDGRTMVGFGFGNRGLDTRLMGYGCDEAFQIDDLMAIPAYLEGALIDLA